MQILFYMLCNTKKDVRKLYSHPFLHTIVNVNEKVSHVLAKN